MITGIAGSGASYLAEYLVNNNLAEVHGMARWHSTTSKSNLENVIDKVKVHECDLMDPFRVYNILNEVKPDYIFHLASHANVRACFDNPYAVVNNNVMGTVNLLEGIRNTKIDPLIQMCSTSEVYGKVEQKDIPIKETHQFNAANPYAASKAAQDQLGIAYFHSFKQKIIRTRMFAYINPRRDDLFATSFALQVARIEEGMQKKLLHGNLDSTRTLIDVRDAMESYWIATTKGKPGEVYNIGGRKIITVGDFLDVLKKLAKTEIPSEVDLDLLRPSDVTLQIPDINKFETETGWKPKYSFEETVEDLLESCRKQVKKEKLLKVN